MAKALSCNLFLNSKCLMNSRYRINVQGMSDTLGYELWEQAADSSAMMTREMFISGKGGCLGIRTKMFAVISLRSCYVFILALNPWVKIIKSQSPSARTSGIHYVSLGCPHLQAGHFPYTSIRSTIYILLSSRIRRPRREPALLWLVSVAPSCPS